MVIGQNRRYDSVPLRYARPMPISTIVMLAVIGGLVVFFMVFNKKRLVAAEAQSANARAGELAQRMGLEVVQGDPMTNLMYARALNTKNTGEMPEVHVRLEGSPGGRFTEVEYYERVKIDRGVTSTTITTWLTAHVAVKVRSPFPAFEVLLKNPKMYASEVKPKITAPPTPFGDPGLDAVLVLKTQDPRVAPVITEALRGVVGWGWVHIHGEGDKLLFHCTKLTATYVGIADQIQFVLDEMAKSLEQAAAAHGAG